MSLKTLPVKENEDDMKANTAATKIQAGFRGYRVRKQLRESARDQESPRESDSEASSPPPLKRHQDHASSRTNLEEKSATKIQAGVRGFLVRKRQQVAAAAATRIQAGFRGFRTRKQLKQSEQ